MSVAAPDGRAGLLPTWPAGAGCAARHASLTHGPGTGAGLHLLPNLCQVAFVILIRRRSLDVFIGYLPT